CSCSDSTRSHEFLNLFLSVCWNVPWAQWCESNGHHRLAAVEASFGISLPLSPHSETPDTDKCHVGDCSAQPVEGECATDGSLVGHSNHVSFSTSHSTSILRPTSDTSS